MPVDIRRHERGDESVFEEHERGQKITDYMYMLFSYTKLQINYLLLLITRSLIELCVTL